MENNFTDKSVFLQEMKKIENEVKQEVIKKQFTVHRPKEDIVRGKKPILKNTIKLIKGISGFNLITNTDSANKEGAENQRFFLRKRKNVDYNLQDFNAELDLSFGEISSQTEKGLNFKKIK